MNHTGMQKTKDDYTAFKLVPQTYTGIFMQAHIYTFSPDCSSNWD